VSECVSVRGGGVGPPPPGGREQSSGRRSPEEWVCEAESELESVTHRAGLSH